MNFGKLTNFKLITLKRLDKWAPADVFDDCSNLRWFMKFSNLNVSKS